ncbi:hypothetical protein JCM19232_2575 [Vibrio ishigakensis]|uniref:Alpha/beta hydrolase n=1 Tax=Vibrio ishigakensis TaxID=1481914 RepID=A0A0B8P9V5_9VIBR|nr:hypothetical protein JCM19232_2575 [Vibrio ishigakensis]
MKSLLITVAVAYILIAIAFYSAQRKFLYFPQSSSSLFGEKNFEISINQETFSGWVLNEGQSKALVYYGGNAENIEANIPFFRDSLAHYTVYLIPYRGYGGNPGSPSEKALYGDALSIVESIKPKHDSISVMGRSLGSGIATYVAANEDIDTLILVSPFDSVENVAREIYWMFPVSLLIKDRYASIDRVQDISAQTHIFIAEYDRVIPRQRSDNLVAEFGSRAQSVIIKKANHNTISEYPAYVSALKLALK